MFTQMQFKQCPEIMSFLGKFPEANRQKVTQYLLLLGIDMAKKLGSAVGSNELFMTLKQLARNIEKQSQGNQENLQQEIQRIQSQLTKLNQLFEKQKDDDELFSADQMRYQEPRDDRYKFMSPPQTQTKKQQTTQPKNKLNYQLSPQSRDNFHIPKTDQQLTAKITESPPPQIVYVQKMNTQINIRRNLDDRQIKQLLYESDNYRFASQYKKGNYIQGQQQPPIITSTSQGKSVSVEQHPNSQKQQKRMKKKVKKLDDNKQWVPQYLKNVQSKIKDQIQYHKHLYREYLSRQQHPQDEDEFQQEFQPETQQSQQLNQDEQWEDFDNDNIKVGNRPVKYQESPHHTAQFDRPQYQQEPTRETQTYYDIQQYLQSQQNPKQQFQFSPVQEMLPKSREYNGSSSSDKQGRQLQFQQVSDFQQSKQMKKKDSQNDFSPPFRGIYSQKYSPYKEMKQSQMQDTMHIKDEEEEESSDSFSNFTPPNQEVREFFQKQFQNAT